MRKGITTRVEVDLAILEENYRSLARHCHPAGIIAVLKGDAYGHGAVHSARAFQSVGCRRCAVSTLDEALQLKKNGISMDIHLLGSPSREQMEIAIDSGLIPYITTPQALTWAEEMAARLRRPSRVHIKVDSGMGRFGLMPSDIPKVLDGLKNLRWTTIEGVGTHLGRAKDDPEFSKMQLDAFETTATQFDRALGRRVIRHALATMAILLYKDTVSHEFVRPGSLLYGLAHSAIPAEVGVRTALSLKTELVQVKDIPRGWNLGYGTNVAETDMRIGLIAAGVTDGFMSTSSSRARVLIRGVSCDIKGISADSSIVDLSPVPDAEIGDEAVIIGRQGKKEITAFELGIISGTNYSEILMKVSPRVPRVYVRNGAQIAVESMA